MQRLHDQAQLHQLSLPFHHQCHQRRTTSSTKISTTEEIEGSTTYQSTTGEETIISTERTITTSKRFSLFTDKAKQLMEMFTIKQNKTQNQ